MTSGDWLMIACWLATVIVLIAIAWEPWRQTRNMTAVDLSDEIEGRAVSPFQIFLLPAVFGLAPFVAQLVPHHRSDEPAIVSPWRHPHLFWPLGLVFLGGGVVLQVLMRVYFLRAARRRRKARATLLEAFANAGRRSGAPPR